MDKKTILLVEDEAVTAMYFKSNLNALGYDVSANASSGEDAVRMATELSPDLIIMDITLDGRMNGIEAAHIIRSNSAIPIIFLTAHSDPETLKQAKKVEPFGYLPKPCDMNTLKSTIEVALYKSETDARMRAAETRMRSAEIRAEKMKAVGVLSGGVAHHFNNILTSIIGYGKLAQDRIEDKTTREYIHEILLAAKQASEITHGLLAFSRQQITNLMLHDLNEIIKISQAALAVAVGDNIDLSIRLSHEALAVMVDRDQIEQVLVHLAINARDAMPGGGILNIYTERHESSDIHTGDSKSETAQPHAALIISDTGTGMDRMTIEHIFEPFFTTKEVGMGTGLGLAMVYGIVKQNGGNITVESESGKGTTFRICLPLV
ncbi:MAG TPA: response regulator [Dissulfurispiraceae bacterium]|nr:response regulator [Dissulfurispiraceae bacterium]